MGNLCCAPAPQNTDDASRGLGLANVKNNGRINRTQELDANTYSQLDINYNSNDEDEAEVGKYQPQRNTFKKQKPFNALFQNIDESVNNTVEYSRFNELNQGFTGQPSMMENSFHNSEDNDFLKELKVKREISIIEHSYREPIFLK